MMSWKIFSAVSSSPTMNISSLAGRSSVPTTFLIAVDRTVHAVPAIEGTAPNAVHGGYFSKNPWTASDLTHVRVLRPFQDFYVAHTYRLCAEVVLPALSLSVHASWSLSLAPVLAHNPCGHRWVFPLGATSTGSTAGYELRSRPCRRRLRCGRRAPFWRQPTLYLDSRLSRERLWVTRGCLVIVWSRLSPNLSSSPTVLTPTAWPRALLISYCRPSGRST